MDLQVLMVLVVLFVFCCSSVLLLNFVCFWKKWFAVVPIVVVVAESVGL
jgi:hypothetical protein